MRLTNEQIKSVAFGAVNVTEDNNGLHFYKCTQKQLEAWRSHSMSLFSNASTSSGIRLDFETNSQSFAFRASAGKKFEIYVDDILRKQFIFEEAGEGRIILSDPLGHKKDNYRVTLYFPSHGACGILEWVELDDGATFTPHRFDRKWLFIGDSITQGWASDHDSLSYAIRTARFFNAECVIQGIGGAYFAEDTFDSIDFDPDIVSVAYGTNDFGHYKTLDELRSHANAHFSLIANEYKSKKLFFISPIWRDHREGKAMGSFEECRAVVIEEAERLGFIHIDGLTLVPPLPVFYQDEYLHPNDNGFSVYAENLILALKDHI